MSRPFRISIEQEVHRPKDVRQRQQQQIEMVPSSGRIGAERLLLWQNAYNEGNEEASIYFKRYDNPIVFELMKLPKLCYELLHYISSEN